MSLQKRLLLSLPFLLVWSMMVTTRERLGPRPIMPRLPKSLRAPAPEPEPDMRRAEGPGAIDPKMLN